MRQIAEVIHWATLSLITTIILVNTESLVPALILGAIALLELWMLGRAVSRVTDPAVNITQTIQPGMLSADDMVNIARDTRRS